MRSKRNSATKSYWWFLRKTRSSPPDSRLRSLDRFSMAETACAASKYPDKIKPSVIEFMLDKPSYTIHTLRHLTENYGTQMRFSILMGDDLVPQLPEWKQYREIIDNYPIFVYPRTGQPLPDLGGRITLLEGAPLYPYSSSEIRERLGRGEDVGNMLPEGVMRYIREKDLWSPASYIASLTARLEATPDDASSTSNAVSGTTAATNGAKPSTTSTGR